MLEMWLMPLLSWLGISLIPFLLLCILVVLILKS